MEIIQFPYRGWILKVTPDSDGYTAHLSHPRQQADNEFFVVATRFDSACDAIKAAMLFADIGTAELAIREVLSDMMNCDRLSLKEFNCLAASIRGVWRKEKPIRAAVEP
ncbi:hypothetical protein H6F90_29725 [Trichocoleus sp. FACHB-591]|uniref:hypothetical protein n=1 Tax=Trichocoleus sp. FACHB-591 TaxID=2692872 RepID=UPI001684D6CC|nr:hypothetical protein [Trichocoleus sp. FACHB-591]MBD2099246.1 hypothetical protein [Trichocoleus sp. FACHB-591]